MRKTQEKYTQSDFERLMDTVRTTKIRAGKAKVINRKSTKYQIEKNVSLPTDKGIYPLFDMLIGDSFVVPLEETKSLRNAIMSTSRRHKKFHFMTRTVMHDDSTRVVRVWRIKKNS